MNREVRDKRPVMPKVEHIELSESNVKRRIIMIVILLAIGGCALTYAFQGLLSTNKGWTRIEADSSTTANGSDELVFNYYLGDSDQGATAENKALVTMYSDMAEYTYQLFDGDTCYDDVVNIAYLNAHPNEVVTVDDTLYNAFSLLDQYENRSIYLGPIYEYYNSVFYCTSQEDAGEYLPSTNEGIAEEYQTLADYASDSNAVFIKLLGDNQVELVVSDDYAKYLSDYSYSKYLDLYWMRNAFIVDYMADTLIAKGYTHGNLCSVDGYTRNLDDSGTYSCAINLYEMEGTTIYDEATMTDTCQSAIVNLKAFPISETDSRYYFELSDGSVQTRYLSTTNGKSQTSISALTGFSTKYSCAEVLLQMSPMFIDGSADDIQVDALDGIDLIYTSEKHIYYEDVEGFTIDDLHEGFSAN